VNGSGLSGDGSAWICKVSNIDLFNAHPVAYGSVCSYPVGAAPVTKKPKPHWTEPTPNPDRQ
jgi:hypothetical protein